MFFNQKYLFVNLNVFIYCVDIYILLMLDQMNLLLGFNIMISIISKYQQTNIFYLINYLFYLNL